MKQGNGSERVLEMKTRVLSKSTLEEVKHPRVLVVGDDLAAVNEVISVLEKAGVRSVAANSVKNVKEVLSQVVVIEEGKGGKGWELSSQIREESNVPILMVGDSNSELAWVKAAAYGIDCYMVKPFAYRELVARIGALVRRYNGSLLGSQKSRTHKVHL